MNQGFKGKANLKKVDEWNDTQFQTKVKFLYDLMHSNPDHSDRGHRIGIKHFLVYVCLRLHHGEGEAYNPHGRNMQPFKIGSYSDDDQKRMLDWVVQHVGMPKKDSLELYSGCSYYWKRTSNANSKANRIVPYCHISNQLGVSWDTEVSEDSD